MNISKIQTKLINNWQGYSKHAIRESYLQVLYYEVMGQFGQFKFVPKPVSIEYIMNFFNKYKDLFGVPDGASFPSSKLSINHTLFMERPFKQSHTQPLSTNVKLANMRKDFTELQNQIQSINNVMKKPKRPNSRRGKQIEEVKEKDKILNSSPFQNSSSPVIIPTNMKNSRLLNHNRKNDSSNVEKSIFTNSVDQSNTKNEYGNKRRRLMLSKNQQPNIEKYNQESYLLKNRVMDEKQKNKYETPITKVEHLGVQNVQLKFPSGRNKEADELPMKIQNNKIENKRRELELQNSEAHVIKKKEGQRMQFDYGAAMKRREEAQRNIKARREKLVNLYRNGY